MLDIKIINSLIREHRVSDEIVRNIISIDAIMSSTKTKAKDFLDGSTTFQERVVKKCSRLKIFESEEYIIYVIKLIEDLYSIENSDNLSSDIEKHLTNFGYYDGY